MFYTIEGIDGAGCGTVRRALEEKLSGSKLKFTSLKYPVPNLPFGKEIYDFLDGKISLPNDVQFLVFAGQMVFEKERLKKLRKNILIVDRYLPCTLVFQGAKGFPIKQGLEFARLFKIEKPNKIFYLKVPWQVGWQRKNAEKRTSDLFEKDAILYKKTAALYNQLARDQVFSRWLEIPADRPVEEIADDIMKVILKDNRS